VRIGEGHEERRIEERKQEGRGGQEPKPRERERARERESSD